jgi:hypothetical protein
MTTPQMTRVTDVRSFLASRGQRSVGVHQWAPLKRIPWPYCKRCGLLALRNEVTRTAMKAACVVEE